MEGLSCSGGNWQVAHARRRRSSHFRETEEIPGNKGTNEIDLVFSDLNHVHLCVYGVEKGSTY